MNHGASSINWVLVLAVIAAVIAGIAVAFWFYAFLAGPPVPQ